MSPRGNEEPAALGELDLHLIGEGRHEQLWHVLGAHVRDDGTWFAVWSPNARSVSVVGDFNGWDGNAHPLQPAPSGGIWTGFVPGVGDGAYYQYLVHGADGIWRQKADPMAFAAEAPPATGSRVFTSTHVWQDDAWLAQRSQKLAVNEPMSVYEMHLGSWKRRPDGSFGRTTSWRPSCRRTSPTSDSPTSS